MTLKAKKKFFKRNWFWCQFHGIWYYDLSKINGDFVRYFNKCAVDLRKL